MIVDGNSIAKNILDDLRTQVLLMSATPHLTVFTCAPNFETQKFLDIKKRKAEEVGIALSGIEFLPEIVTKDVITSIETAVENSDGIIVQFPFPSHIDVDAVVSAIPPSHDVDVLNPKTTNIVSPVIGAFIEILEREEVEVVDKKVIVVGAGKLVGQPAVKWFEEQGAHVTTVIRETLDAGTYIKDADIIVLGAGQPGFIKPEHIKEGVIILDAGTSEVTGVLRGDADSACAKKSAVFTPVPGGIGPITIAVLLQNLLFLCRKTN